MILFYIRKTLYIENAFHWNSVLRSLLLTSMWHFSVVRLFVKACRGGRKGGSFLQLYNITGICAFILCEVHYSTLFSVSTHREGKPTTVLRSKKEVTFGQQNIRLSFLWNSARRGFALFFLCASNVYWFTFDKYWMDTCVTLLLFLACWTLVNNKCHFSREVEKRELKYHHIECCLFFTCKDNKTESFECAWCAVKKTPVWQQHISVKTIIHV